LVNTYLPRNIIFLILVIQDIKCLVYDKNEKKEKFFIFNLGISYL
jgi:hypothetical protein